MACPLTPDAIMAISLRGAQDLHPLVQVIDIRQIGSAQERFRLILSDSVHLQQAMLATQLNEDVTSGKCLKGSCVRLREYICNTVQNKKIIIVLSMDVEIQNADIYGTPVPVPVVDDKADTGSGSCQQNPNQAVPPPIPQPSWQQPAQQSTQQTFMTSNALKTGSGMSIGNMNSSVAANNGWGKPLGTSNGTSGFQVSRGMGSGPSPTGAAVGFAGGSGVGSGSGFGNMGGEGAGAYGRHGMSFSNQPAPMFSSRGPIVKNEAPARVVPIKSLSPYQGRWTIKVRVTSKTDKRKFNKAQSTGTVFSFDLLDQDKGEIRATAFNEVAEKLYNLVHVGHVYILSKGTLKAAQPKYNQLNNPWELTLDGSSILEPVADDFLIPQQVFSFVPICNIEDMENNKMVDIVGIVVAINPTTTITRKNGSDTQKRSLHLRDMSGKSVEVTMWGDFCNREGLELQELCDSGQYPVLLVKAGRISDFNGKSVGTISSTLLSINPDMTEARRLREWFDREGKNLNCQSVSKEGGTSARSELRKTIGQIKDEGLGRGDKPDWITVKATVYFVKEENFFYPACPLKSGGDRQCNKKLTNMGDGTWRCEKCGQDVSECDYRYLLAVQVQDDTGQTWLTAFQEGGEDIMGISAKDLNQLKLDGDPKYGEIFSKVNFSQRLFKLKVKEEHYNDEQRVKCTVVRSEKLDFAQECQLLVDLIGKIDRGEPIHSISVNGGGGGFKGVFPVNGGDSGRQTTSLIGGSAPAPYNNLGYLQSSYDRSNTNDGAAKTGCFKCGSEGHYARDCPNAAASASSGGGFDYGFSGRGSGARGGGGFDNSFSGGSGGRGGGTNTCYKCGQPGHWANSCPSNESGGGGGRSYSGGQGGRGGGRGTGYGGGGYNTGGYSGF